MKFLNLLAKIGFLLINFLKTGDLQNNDEKDLDG